MRDPDGRAVAAGGAEAEGVPVLSRVPNPPGPHIAQGPREPVRWPFPGPHGRGAHRDQAALGVFVAAFLPAYLLRGAVKSAPVRGFLNLNRRELPCGQAGLRAVARGFGELVGDQLLKRGQRRPRVLIRSFSAVLPA